MKLDIAVINETDTRMESYFKSHYVDKTSLNWKANRPPSFYAQIVYKLVNSNFPKALKLKANDLDYAGWFNYFKAEVAAPTGSDEVYGRMLAMFYKLGDMLTIERKPNNKVDFAFNPRFNPTRTSDAILRSIGTNALARAILDCLLREGFSAVGVNSKVGFENVSTAALDSEHFFGNLFGMRSAVATDAERSSLKDDMRFAFRGETRTVAVLKSHGGAKCRADLDSWRKDSNLTKPWHPWSGVHSNKSHEVNRIWIRNGSQDNDYYTANSIAMDFHVACSYPIFRMREIGKEYKHDVNAWSDDLRLKFRQKGRSLLNKPNFCLIKPKNKMHDEFAVFDRTWVYVILLSKDSQVAATYQTGADYPEAAVRDIPLTSYLACLEVERIHVFPNGLEYYESSKANPVSMTCTVLSWNFVNGDRCAKTLAGVENVGALRGRLNSLVGKPFDINHRDLVTESVDQTYFTVRTKKEAKVLPPNFVPSNTNYVQLSNR